MAYSYEPLESSEHVIRLLHIEPKDTTSTDLLACKLCNVSLDSNSEYETISYCWGDPTPCRTVIIDGKELRIPNSSATVLSQLTSSGQARAIWIDAICINQADVAERGHQVSLMRRIYSQARRNIIYLGEGDAMSSSGFGIVSAIDQEIDTLGEIPKKGLQTPVDEDALVALFSLPWFSRVWVVQEAVLARDSICILGDTQIDFEDITRFIRFLGQYPGFRISSVFQGLVGSMSIAITGQFRYLLTSGQRLELKDALSACMQLKCTDMRDKVFGILGMCEQSNAASATSTLLSIDYTKPYQHVFRDATRYAIATTRPAEGADGLPFILRWISHRSESDLQDSSLPSWVPHFDREGNFELDDATLYAHGVDITKRVQNWMEELRDPDILELRGTVLGKIVQASPVFDSGVFKDPIQVRELLAVIRSMVAPDKLSSSLARTLIADTNYQSRPSTQGDLAGLQSMLAVIGSGRPVGRLAGLSSTEQDDDTAAATFYYEALLQGCRNRRFITTDRGEIGLAPRMSQVGDIIAALWADCGGTPYVLHLVGGCYKLIGACYLDGFMPGQQQEQRGSSQENVSTFAIS